MYTRQETDFEETREETPGMMPCRSRFSETKKNIRETHIVNAKCRSLMQNFVRRLPSLSADSQPKKKRRKENKKKRVIQGNGGKSRGERLQEVGGGSSRFSVWKMMGVMPRDFPELLREIGVRHTGQVPLDFLDES